MVVFREKAERKNDPNVEYIDMNEFTKGTKKGDESGGKASSATTVSEELLQAKSVLQSSEVSTRRPM